MLYTMKMAIAVIFAIMILISFILKKTQIKLFKAHQKDTRVVSEDVSLAHDYVKQLKYNNVDKLVYDINQIQVVDIIDAHHGNILEYEDILLSNIVED